MQPRDFEGAQAQLSPSEMADEPPPMEEEQLIPEASQEEDIEQPPTAPSPKPEEEPETEPPSLEPQTESEPAQLEPQSPPPVVEVGAVDEGDEVPLIDPLAKSEPPAGQRTLDLFEEEKPAPQHTTSQVSIASSNVCVFVVCAV